MTTRTAGFVIAVAVALMLLAGATLAQERIVVATITEMPAPGLDISDSTARSQKLWESIQRGGKVSKVCASDGKCY